VSREIGQPLRFLAVGVVGYAVNLLAFVGLLSLEVAYVSASVLSYLISNMLMYLGNRYFTFRLGQGGFWTAYARYLAVGLVVVVLNAVFLAGLVELASINARLAQAFSLLAVTPVAFVLFKRWTFRV
jgi:dolichol-phosphate mannosyltransferase